MIAGEVRKSGGVSVIPRFERAVRCTLALQSGQVINAPWLVATFRLSLAQAKRDLEELERVLPVVRERGRLQLLRGVAS